MITGIPIITKIKPVQIVPLSSGSKKLATDQKGGIFQTNLKNNLKVLSNALRENETEAVGTSVTAVIVLGATTMSDTIANDVCLLLSESKAGLFKSALKNIDKFVKKGTKEIATCRFVYEGKKENNTLILGIEILPACKMKMAPVIKWLNKVGKPTNLKFEMATGIKPEESTSEETTQIETPTSSSPKLSILEQLIQRLENAENDYKLTPTSDNLMAWGKVLAKFKQVLAKQPENDNLKSTFKEWLLKYNLVKKQSETNTDTDANSSKEILDRRLTDLENNLKTSKDDSLSELLQLMAVCQEIRVQPSFKTILKENVDLMNRFKRIRKQLQILLQKDNDQFDEMQSLLESPSTITEKFQLELDDLWFAFSQQTQTTESFNDILANDMVEMKATVKQFQQTVEAQAKGMLEASKILKIGNPVEISQQMTVIRSGIVKLKETMAARIKTIETIAKELAQLEVDFLATEDLKLRQTIFSKVENLTNNLAQNSASVSIF